MEKLENLLSYILKGLVEKQDEVRITYELIDDTIIFKVNVAEGAIRGVMQAAGVKDKLNVNVEFLD